MAELELIGHPTSNYVWSCRIALAEKGVAYRLEPALPHSAEARAAHPLGKIPAIRHGNLILAESRAIYAYIDRAFEGPLLVPSALVSAVKVEQWLALVNTSIDPIWIRGYARAYRTASGRPDRAYIEGLVKQMAPQFSVMDEAVRESGHLVGETFTLADINFLPMLCYVRRFQEGAELLAHHTELASYVERHLQKPSVRETMPQLSPPIVV